MSWSQFALARQYVVEEAIGTRLRQAKRDEDAEFRATQKAIHGRQGNR